MDTFAGMPVRGRVRRVTLRNQLVYEVVLLPRPDQVAMSRLHIKDKEVKHPMALSVGNTGSLVAEVRRNGRFGGRHVLSVSQFDKDAIAYVLMPLKNIVTMARKWLLSSRFKDTFLLTSLRTDPHITSSSFMAAMRRLGVRLFRR